MQKRFEFTTCIIIIKYIDRYVRWGGPEGSEVDFHFFDVSNRGERQLPGTFFGMEKYCS